MEDPARRLRGVDRELDGTGVSAQAVEAVAKGAIRVKRSRLDIRLFSFVGGVAGILPVGPARLRLRAHPWERFPSPFKGARWSHGSPTRGASPKEVPMSDKNKKDLKEAMQGAEISDVDLDTVAGGTCNESCQSGCSMCCESGSANRGPAEIEAVAMT